MKAFSGWLPNAAVNHAASLNPTLCGEFNLIQKPLPALHDISLPY